MRLLQRHADGSFSLTRDLLDNIPRYAILSHTWGSDDQEVTFRDIEANTGQDKDGYKKLIFCARQAAADDLHHFWIDTCCIDKFNIVELGTAINSMFRWYRDSEKCYVYLPDVSDTGGPDTWKVQFRRSRWMTRGWTLQELIAPSSVEFFSTEGSLLGNKHSLMNLLHETTGIATTTLEGKPLADLSINERFSWIETRSTKLPEDRVYCMFGIFNVQLALIYGEGEENARRRLVREVTHTDAISEDGKKCIAALHGTDPRVDKKRIQDTKGGLLENSYTWVLENEAFRRWHDDDSQRLLWVQGDPGKGKTMLLCGIIDSFHTIPRNHTQDSLAYFFCQATDERLNSSLGIIRGLIMMLLEKDLSLLTHLEKKYRFWGEGLFNGKDAWYQLSGIFITMLRAMQPIRVTVVVDALDECIEGLPGLLDLIITTSASSHHVKWLISSRNLPDIEERLGSAANMLSLELNANSVADAVKFYIDYKISHLTKIKKYRAEVAREIHHHLSSNAHDTFLWVALVCQELEKTPGWKAVQRAKSFPSGLDHLYNRMMRHVRSSEDVTAYTRILGLAVTAYGPLSLEAFAMLLEDEFDFANDLDALQDVISSCGSFLVIRENAVYFVHQSAKDFLSKQSGVLFTNGPGATQGQIFSTSIDIMSAVLRRDIYRLEEPGFSVADVVPPKEDPLKGLRYFCVHWIDHLIESNDTTEKDDAADRFLRSKCLNWFEALSLLGGATSVMIRLKRLIDNPRSPSLNEVAHEAYRVLQHFRPAIEESPLQAYASVLVFSPTRSLIRELYSHEAPKWVKLPDCILREHWSSCEMTIEAHGDAPRSVSFSPDGHFVLSAYDTNVVKLWNSITGECQLMLEGTYSDFSPDGRRILSICDSKKSIKIWSSSTGVCKSAFQCTGFLTYARFSPNGRRIISISENEYGQVYSTLQVWDLATGSCELTMTLSDQHRHPICSVGFSANSQEFLTADTRGMVRFWEIATSACLKELIITDEAQESHQGSDSDSSTVFSDSGHLLSTTGDTFNLLVWDLAEMQIRTRLVGHKGPVQHQAFSRDESCLVSAETTGIVKVWRLVFGHGICFAEVRDGWIVRDIAVSLSKNADRVAITSFGGEKIRIWNTEVAVWRSSSNSYDPLATIAFSPDGQRVFVGPRSGSSTVWNVETGKLIKKCGNLGNPTIAPSFSKDGEKVIYMDERSGVITTLDIRSNTCTDILRCNQNNSNKGFETAEDIFTAESVMFPPYQNMIERFEPAKAVFTADKDRFILVRKDDMCQLWSTSQKTDTLQYQSWVHFSSFQQATPGTLQGLCKVEGIWSLMAYTSGEHGSASINPVTFDVVKAALAGWKPWLPPPNYEHEASMSQDNCWIMRRSKRILWLPAVFRPSAFAAFTTGDRTVVVMNCEAAALFIAHFT